VSYVDRGAFEQRAQVWVLLFATVVAAPACVSHYTMPAANEPHAIVKLRISYHARAGTALQHGLMINGEAIDIPQGSGDLDSTTTHALRVREEPTQWAVSSMYYHMEMQTRMVTDTAPRATAARAVTGQASAPPRARGRCRIRSCEPSPPKCPT